MGDPVRKAQFDFIAKPWRFVVLCHARAGVKADLDIVTVFTNSRVTLKAVPSARIHAGYKGFEVSALFQGVMKRDFPMAASTYLFSGDSNFFKEHLDYYNV